MKCPWWQMMMILFMFSVCFQSCTCWCTMSFLSCLCGLTGKPSSPSPWTPWRRWVWLRRSIIVGLGWWGIVGSADVGYSLPVWLKAAFRLIILSSGSAWSCTLMALILTTALQLCSVNTHTNTHIDISYRGHFREKPSCISISTEAKHMQAIITSYESFLLWDAITGSLEVL